MKDTRIETRTGEELKNLFLNGELDTKSMCKDSYEKLFKYEIEQEEPDGDIIVLCSDGLQGFKEYRKNKHAKRLYKELVKRYKEGCKEKKKNQNLELGKKLEIYFLVENLIQIQ